MSQWHVAWSNRLISNKRREYSVTMFAVPVVTEFATMRDQGVHAIMESQTRFAGGPSLLGALHVTPPRGLAALDDAASARGEGVSF